MLILDYTIYIGPVVSNDKSPDAVPSPPPANRSIDRRTSQPWLRKHKRLSKQILSFNYN